MGFSPVAELRLLTVAPCLAAAHGLWAGCLWASGSEAQARRLLARAWWPQGTGDAPDRGSSPRLLRGQRVHH